MLAQLECPRRQTQALHRQRLVLVLLALVLHRHRLVLVSLSRVVEVSLSRVVEVSLSRVVDASGLASWVLRLQRLVLELLAPAPGLHCC